MDGSLDPKAVTSCVAGIWRTKAAIRDFYRDRPYLDPNAVLLKVGMRTGDLPIGIASTIGQCSLNWTVDTPARVKNSMPPWSEAAASARRASQPPVPLTRTRSHWLRGFLYQILPPPRRWRIHPTPPSIGPGGPAGHAHTHRRRPGGAMTDQKRRFWAAIGFHPAAGRRTRRHRPEHPAPGARGSCANTCSGHPPKPRPPDSGRRSGPFLCAVSLPRPLPPLFSQDTDD